MLIAVSKYLYVGVPDAGRLRNGASPEWKRFQSKFCNIFWFLSLKAVFCGRVLHKYRFTRCLSSVTRFCPVISRASECVAVGKRKALCVLANSREISQNGNKISICGFFSFTMFVFTSFDKGFYAEWIFFGCWLLLEISFLAWTIMAYRRSRNTLSHIMISDISGGWKSISEG